MSTANSKKVGVTFFSVLFGMLAGAVILILLYAFGFFHPPFSTGPEKAAEGNLPLPSPNVLQTVASLEDEITNSRQNAIVRAAQKVGPAVVSISVVQVRMVRQRPFFSPFGDEFWGRFFRPREYKEKVYGIGSGFIINPDGYILTNAHVIREADQLKVTLTTGDEYEGTVTGFDEASDLAVIKIDAEDLPWVALGNSSDLITGEWAIAVGNPFGYLLDDPNPTVTVGVISAVNRDIKRERGQVQIYRKMIQTDAAINPGNSGGALVNAAGEVIGINTFIFTKSGGSLGIGFAIPINTVQRILEEFTTFGRIRPVWVGVQVQEMTPLLALSLDLETTDGVLVSHVDEGSPAERAGVERGDVVQRIAGKKIRSVEEAQRALADAIVGDEITFHLVRRDQAHDMVLQLVERPEEGGR
ncbi:MAG: trypsin-like peptidase domain-containing protein [Candidatus Eisenbacteria sp.]|nr:trypsin-like peptidase domain-containing protein [Candidatus Eisenbacteria bacterium]